ncbi:mannose-1-phosphate guanylyltransferase [Betaproteobacteria bacterium GR16-43]|nr:mannose-1-phosphate guanylyltransferase [Betaproteobacteria bacterium GR16-43]
MKAIVLAAGRGARLQPLTDATPKPLLGAGGKRLIEWQVEALVAGGITELVVNHAYLGSQIVAALGDGSRYGASIRYSAEDPALETAGGIARALSMLGDEPFLAVSADIYTRFDYGSLHSVADDIARRPRERAAHFVLVPNPDYHPSGDMGLRDGRVTREAKPWLTYGNISVFHPEHFLGVEPNVPMRLFPWMYEACEAGRVSGELYQGPWDNVGTAAQLADLDRRLSE